MPGLINELEEYHDLMGLCSSSQTFRVAFNCLAWLREKKEDIGYVRKKESVGL